ncbi:DUF3253 domain-containing protein [Microbacterium sp.]|uniref:DUF3253 domain-containing protein n=1 Tax=Microbacterium sp. TaxID=51671 RepID=UPI00281160D3|nr:DUF3253 domain-containing protein [Microbacterium sp.]
MTPDGRYIVVNGRRWRATDPTIPPKLRQELVDELMSARRAVKNHESGARERVDDAKQALGERGHPWWEDPTTEELDERSRAAIHALVRKRSESSICPSDVARIVGGEGESWRRRMPDVRRVAADMAREGEVVITQKGKVVDLDEARGPVRISRGPAL